jgi:hypothetical protein
VTALYVSVIDGKWFWEIERDEDRIESSAFFATEKQALAAGRARLRDIGRSA